MIQNNRSVKIHVISIRSISQYNYFLLFYVGRFDDFLMDMKQSKRKNIRQERKKVCIHYKKHLVT